MGVLLLLLVSLLSPLVRIRGVVGVLLEPQRRELEFSISGSSRPTNEVVDKSVGCLAWMAS